MCGIAGIISAEGVDVDCLRSMSHQLRHRGMDDEGFFLHGANELFLKGDDTVSELSSLPHINGFDHHEKYTLGFAHRRLSIIDRSSAGHQPMHKDGLVIIFNGEIYNYKELRTELQKTGFVFSTDSDTEVILNAYKHWGKDCVKRFSGMWALAIFDQKANELFLSRDRFGIKPLYYYFNERLFAFASEIKSLFTLKEIEPLASLNRAFEFVSYGATADPLKNIFTNIQQVPPSYNLVFKIFRHELQSEKYYDLETEVKNYHLPENTSETFDELLDNSVRLHLRSDVEIGSALSGGLDSGTLVALAAKSLDPSAFKTFTATYAEKKTDESFFAKLVSSSQKNIQAHYAFPDSETYWKDLEKLTWHQDLPVSSTSMFAQWEVMKTAAGQNIKVLLDGQGADEILGGYYNFAGLFLLEQLRKFHFAKFSRERKLLKQNFTPGINTAIMRAGFYFLPSFLQRLARSKKRLAFDFISPDYKHLLSNVTVPQRGGFSFKEQSFLSMEYGMQDLLRYEDRNSMAFGIESRVPFLDQRLVEFCIALDEDQKIKDGWTKYILRKKAEKILPGEVAWRKDKMGFLTPQQSWKKESREKLLAFLNEENIPEFIDKKYLLNLCNSDFANPSHLSEFWKMISFIQWARVFKVRFS